MSLSPTTALLSLRHSLDPLQESPPLTPQHTQATQPPLTHKLEPGPGESHPSSGPCSHAKSNCQTLPVLKEAGLGGPALGRGRKGGSKQALLVGTKQGSVRGLEFFKNRQLHTSLLSLPTSPLTLIVSSKSGRLGPGVGITGGTGGLRGRTRTLKH